MLVPLALASATATLVTASGAQIPTGKDMLSPVPKFASFTFNTPSPIAELLFALPGAVKDGEQGVRWGRAMAKGTVRLTTNTDIQINLCYDGLEHLDQLAALKNCRVACFSANTLDFEDKHILALKNFKDLRAFSLVDTLVTDKALEQIGLFPRMGALNLTKTNVTGSGFDHLKNLHRLYFLSIEGTSLKAGNINKLKTLMPNLVIFDVTRTSLSKQDAAILKDLKLIRELRIGSNSQIDNDCVKYFNHMPALTTLSIEDTAITDKSLPEILKLPKLHKVVVRDKTFWSKKNHPIKIGAVVFYDISHFSNAPVEVFDPLH